MGSTNSSVVKHTEVSSSTYTAPAANDILGNETFSTTNTNTLPKTVTGSSRFGRSNNLEIYSLIWLDKNVNANEDNLQTQKKLRGAINQLKVFDDADQCVSYVKDTIDQKIVLIVSNAYCRQVVPELHNLSQISSFYIYGMNKEANREWSTKFEKVKDIVTRSDQLVEQLKKDQRVRERTDDSSMVMKIYSRDNSGSISIQQQRDSRNAYFMYFLLFIDILLKIPRNDAKAKQELIEIWNENYNDNEEEQATIRKFQTSYEPSKAIYWYTKESFLYRILNKGLRDVDIDILFGLRFFITDLYEQLTNEHKNYIHSLKDKDLIINVYRGQAIALGELNLIQESIGEFISFNNFLSTSTKRSMALSFAHNATLTEEMTRILLVFTIDTRLPDTKPFADISQLSAVKSEDEILIMLGSIFKIKEVKYDRQGQIWVATLSLCSEGDYELKELIAHLKNEVGNGFPSLGGLLIRQGEFEKSTKYYRQMLNEPMMDDSDRAACYRGLGANARNFNDYDEALMNYEKELELLLKMGNDESIAYAYKSIGEIYCYKREFDLALSYQQKALAILPENHPKLSSVYRQIGNIYDDTNEFDLSIEYNEKALKIDYQYLPPNHQNIGITCTNMGTAYKNKYDYKKALEYYYKAREIYMKAYPPTHQNVLYLEEDIRLIEAKFAQT